jgi:ADP-ribose pyrophosphatase YjhB (NUDIX family)
MPHIHEKIDFTVEVFIVYENKILLRRHDKYKIWLSVGGHIELDEDPNQAAIREVNEETGLSVKLMGELPPFENPQNYQELLAPRFLNRHQVSETHEHVTLVYFALAKTNKVFPSKGETSEGIRWFKLEELDEPQYGIQADIKFYARKALEELRNK